MSPAPLAQQNANIAEEVKKVLAALQGTWKLAIREEAGEEGTDIGDPCTIKNTGSRYSFSTCHLSFVVFLRASVRRHEWH